MKGMLDDRGFIVLNALKESYPDRQQASICDAMLYRYVCGNRTYCLVGDAGPDEEDASGQALCQEGKYAGIGHTGELASTRSA
jgi:hypothetical protein